MKYLILLLIVLAVAWFWRKGRDAGAPRAPAAKKAPPLPQDMVQCPVCLVHLPRADALPGPDGQLYCCTEHRSRNG